MYLREQERHPENEVNAMRKFWLRKKDEDDEEKLSEDKEEKQPIELNLTDSDKERLKEMIEQAEREKYEKLGNLIGSRKGKK